MKASDFPSDDITTRRLKTLGEEIRTRRKQLRISAIATAEAAGISRITLHRIEKGEASVAMGAYGKTLTVLGLAFHAEPSDRPDTPVAPKAGWIPARIALAHYPQLNTLAWHARGIDTLTPVEAFNIYERNARHLDTAKLTQSELDLLEALRLAFAYTRSPHHA